MPCLRYKIAHLLAAVLIVVCAGLARAELAPQRDPLPLKADGLCQATSANGVKSTYQWSELEYAVWRQLCASSVADVADLSLWLNELIDPSDAQNKFTLSLTFLRTILSEQELSEALGKKAIRLRDARFSENVDLSDVNLRHELSLENFSFEGGLNISGVKSSQKISIEGTYVGRGLDMRNIRTQAEINLSKDSSFEFIDLRGAKILGDLRIQGTRVNNKLEMSDAQVTGNVFLTDSQFAYVSLAKARVGGLIDTNGSSFSDQLNMESILVGGSILSGVSLRTNNNTTFSQVTLSNSKIQGRIDFQETVFNNLLEIDSAKIRKNVFIRDSILHSDIHISNARIGENMVLGSTNVAGYLVANRANIDRNLIINQGSRFDIMDLSDSVVGGIFFFSDSNVRRFLRMRRINIGQELLIEGQSKLRAIDMRNATIAGRTEIRSVEVSEVLIMTGINAKDISFSDNASIEIIDLSSAKLAGNLKVNKVNVANEFILNATKILGGGINISNGVKAGRILLRGAEVEEGIFVSNAEIDGEFDLTGAKIDKSISIREGAQFAGVRLSGIHVQEDIEINSKHIGKHLTLESAIVGKNISINGENVGNNISFYFANVGHNLEVYGNNLPHLDFSWAKINGELRLGQEANAATWRDGTEVKLRHMQVGVVPDLPTSSPQTVTMEGFSYSRIGNIGLDGEFGISEDKVKRFVDWLGKSPYSPQPYRHMSGVLRTMGHDSEAKEILYAGKQRERDNFLENGMIFHWIWSTALYIFIGYGYKTYLAIFWFLGFTILGSCIFVDTKESFKQKYVYGLAYSLDMLLPVIRLREKHYNIDFSGSRRPVRYYFYFHQLMGYVLASFLIAGLSGLTK